ncbi:MAG: hypothetical protein M3N53_02890 [Actinomycetota bacterium]|nr:hypothetical protein [Actinomycetota bacterium]
MRCSRTALAAGLLLTVIVAAAGCERDGPTVQAAPDFRKCGLPAPDRDADPTLVPAPYLLDGEASVNKTDVVKGRVIAALAVPFSVNESFVRYKEAVAETSMEVLQEDNEGFEAELYLQEGKQLGSLQIRSSTCENAVIVYLNLPAEKAAR